MHSKSQCIWCESMYWTHNFYWNLLCKFVMTISSIGMQPHVHVRIFLIWISNYATIILHVYVLLMKFDCMDGILMTWGNQVRWFPEHILKWIMQLIVLNMNVIMDELWSKLCAGCVIDNLGSLDIGETLPKFC